MIPFYTYYSVPPISVGQSESSPVVTMFLDPGPTTGVAVTINTTVVKVLDFQVGGRYADFYRFIEIINPTKIVYEGFFLYPRMSVGKKFSSLPEVEIIGIIKLFADQHQREYQTHGASLIKDFTKKEVANYLELPWVVMNSISNHAFDALRHCFYYQLRSSQE